jgi:CheY-like chemotaxis protein
MTARILLVEDSVQDAELALAALDEGGLAGQVTVMRDGQEALDYLQRHAVTASAARPAVVLLDVKMPRVDGLEVLERVKRDPRLNAVPVVMLTSSREETDIARSYAMGCNAYVVKHLDYGEFAAALKALAVFWGQVNQPPPGTVARDATALAHGGGE